MVPSLTLYWHGVLGGYKVRMHHNIVCVLSQCVQQFIAERLFCNLSERRREAETPWDGYGVINAGITGRNASLITRIADSSPMMEHSIRFFEDLPPHGVVLLNAPFWIS